MRRKPAGDRRRMDGMAVTGGQAAAGFFKGVAAIIGGERIENFMERICLFAQSARAGRERRSHDWQRYSRTVSSFLVRLPLGAMFRLLQDGQRSGGLIGDRALAGLFGRAEHPASIAWLVLRSRTCKGPADRPATDLQGERGCKAATNLQGFW